MIWKRALIVVAHAFVGWLLCDLTMVIGMALVSLDAALIIHALVAPIYFVVISTIFFRRFGYTGPVQTALTFLAFVMAIDLFVVAMLINRSFEMFASVLGTWIPFASIFVSTWITGVVVTRKQNA